MIKADETERGKKYRPTQVKSFDLRGHAWLTRAAPAWEKKAIQKLRLRYQRLSGREMYMLARVDKGEVLMRRHWKAPGCKVQSEWCAVPTNYNLRDVKR